MHVTHSWECTFNIDCLGVGGGGGLKTEGQCKVSKISGNGEGEGVR